MSLSRISMCETSFAATWLRDEEMPSWDAFVCRHERGLASHLSGWRRALEGTFPHLRGHVLAVKDGSSGRLVAGLPIYVARSWLLGTRLLSVPFASLADPLVTRSSHWDLLCGEILRRRVEERARYVQVSAMPGSKLLGRTTMALKPQRHHYVALNKPLGQVMAGFSRMAVRHPIKKAKQSGLEVVRGTDETALAHFHRLFAESRRRVSLPSLPQGFFAGLVQYLGPEHADLFMCHQGGEPLAGVFTTRMQGRMVLEYSGATMEGRRRGALHLAYWGAIESAHVEGVATCSFGRTSPRNAGLLAHKRHWGTVEEDMPVFTYPATQGDGVGSESSWRARAVRAAIRLLPGVLYRRVGEFCYRHWA